MQLSTRCSLGGCYCFSVNNTYCSRHTQKSHIEVLFYHKSLREEQLWWNWDIFLSFSPCGFMWFSSAAVKYILLICLGESYPLDISPTLRKTTSAESGLWQIAAQSEAIFPAVHLSVKVCVCVCTCAHAFIKRIFSSIWQYLWETVSKSYFQSLPFLSMRPSVWICFVEWANQYAGSVLWSLLLIFLTHSQTSF